ncbi:MAG: hypothetical protein L6R28_16970 [Planctomycetes bacterium]|nr:hypothetical protein [Planctomycetota bacterium]
MTYEPNALTPEEALALCQAYLDGELEAPCAERVEAALRASPELAATFEAQRQFHALLRKRCADVPLPANLRDCLRASLDAHAGRETKRVEAPPPLRLPRRRSASPLLMAAAALMALVTGFAFVELGLLGRECPYMQACTSAAERAEAEPVEFAVKVKDTADLKDALKREIDFDAKDLSALDKMELTPVSVGRAHFDGGTLGQMARDQHFHVPDGVYVKLAAQQPEEQPVTLLMHPWPEETPSSENRMDYRGKDYYFADHDRFRVVCFKTADGRMLCTVVSKRPKERMLEIARAMRESFDDE